MINEMKVNLCLYFMMYVIVVERYLVDQSKTDRVTKLLAKLCQRVYVSLDIMYYKCEDEDRDFLE
jgi:hypothetical protein